MYFSRSQCLMMVPADVAIVIEVVSVKTKLDKFLISA